MSLFLRWVKRVLIFLVLLCCSISLALFVFKDQIIRKVVEQANTYLKVPVEVRQIDVHFWRTFPRISVAFEDLYINDPLSKKDTMLRLEQLSLRFNPFDLISGNYHVQQVSAFNGFVNLSTTANGESNFDIFKNDSNKSSPFNLKLKAIRLDDIIIAYRAANDAYFFDGKIHSSTLSGKFSDAHSLLNASGNISIQQIKKQNLVVLKKQPLDFDVQLQYNQKEKRIKLPQAQINIAHLPFLIDGEFEPEGNSLDIRSNGLSMLPFIRLLSPTDANQIAKIKANGSVDFQLHYQSAPDLIEPKIAAYFKIKNGELTEPNYGSKIRDLTCFGTYQNLPIDEIKIDRFTFKSEGSSFDGNLLFKDFNDPSLNIGINGKLPLAFVHALYPLAQIQKIKGDAFINLKGHLVSNKNKQWQIKSLDGQANIKASQLMIQDFKNHFEQINAKITFNKNDIQINDCKAKIGSSDFIANLKIMDYRRQFSSKSPYQIFGNMEAKSLDLNDFQQSAKASSRAGIKSDNWLLTSFLELNFPFRIQTLNYDNKVLTNLKGKLNFSGRRIALDALGFKHASGNWNGEIQMREVEPAQFIINCEGAVHQVDLKTLFRQWNNFDQSVFVSEQLAGTAQLDYNLNFKYNADKGLDEQSLLAKINCQIEDGRLYKAPILQELAQSLTFAKQRPILGAKNQEALKKKLQDVRFATLRNSVLIANRKISFEKMHIASNALDIDLVGQHTFDHHIDYAVSLRLRDLLIQETQSEFGQIMDDGTGIHLYVRCTGSLDDPKVSWDKLGKQQAAKQQFEQSQKETKAMLKKAFGLYQNDPTIEPYQEKTNSHETIRLNFNEKDNKEKNTPSKTQPPKNGKLKQQLEKWKQEQEQSEKILIKIGG